VSVRNGGSWCGSGSSRRVARSAPVRPRRAAVAIGRMAAAPPIPQIRIRGVSDPGSLAEPGRASLILPLRTPAWRVRNVASRPPRPLPAPIWEKVVKNRRKTGALGAGRGVMWPGWGRSADGQTFPTQTLRFDRSKLQICWSAELAGSSVAAKPASNSPRPRQGRPHLFQQLRFPNLRDSRLRSDIRRPPSQSPFEPTPHHLRKNG
jgi:hypothetical protein